MNEPHVSFDPAAPGSDRSEIGIVGNPGPRQLLTAALAIFAEKGIAVAAVKGITAEDVAGMSPEMLKNTLAAIKAEISPPPRRRSLGDLGGNLPAPLLESKTQAARAAEDRHKRDLRRGRGTVTAADEDRYAAAEAKRARRAAKRLRESSHGNDQAQGSEEASQEGQVQEAAQGTAGSGNAGF